MATQYRQGTVAFLSSTQSYGCDVPVDFDANGVEIVGVVELDARARALVYQRGPAPETLPFLELEDETQSNGVKVSILHAAEDSSLLSAYWHLGDDSYLYTTMPDRGVGSYAADPAAGGRKSLDALIEGLEIAWRDGLPVLSVSEPLHFGDIRDVRQRELVTIAPTAGADAGPVLQFRLEPGWTRQTDRAQALDDGAWAEAAVTTASAVRVSCMGPVSEKDKLTEIAEHVAATLGPN